MRSFLKCSRSRVKRERMNHQLFTLNSPEVSEVSFTISTGVLLTLTYGKFTTLETKDANFFPERQPCILFLYTSSMNLYSGIKELLLPTDKSTG